QVGGRINDFPLIQPPRSPVTYSGSAVINDVRARDEFSKRFGIVEVAGAYFDAMLSEKGVIALGPHQSPNVLAARRQLLPDMAAQQPGRTCNRVHFGRHHKWDYRYAKRGPG